MARLFIGKNKHYWENVFIASGQVFFGIAAAILFTGGQLDAHQLIVVLLNIVLVIFCYIAGSKL